MKPTFFLLLLTATLALSEYPRMKYRGPPPYPKPPPYHQIAKKWQQRPPIRPRPNTPNQYQPRGPNQPHLHNQPHPHNQNRPPIPVHMPNHHKIQMGVAASVNRPVAVPVRNFWKNTQPQTTFRPPIDHFVTSAPVLPKKVFQSSPAILAQEYDFQIQSNNIPTPIKTIKQIGEKGPIHTIPAPNLSLADKPLVVEEVKPKGQRPSGLEEVKRQPEVATFVQIQKAHQYQVTEAPEYPKQTYKTYQESYQPHQESYQPQNTPTLTPTELYQLLNAYQQPATISIPALQQDYLQFPPIVAQQPQNYVDQIPEQFAMDKSGNEEVPPTPKKDSTSLVTATYNLEPEASESIVHSQYVQNYFDTRDGNGNNVEPDAKPSQNSSDYYVTLPNKEAAESLANLQAAGQLNSNLMQMAKNGQELPVSIYVPEEGENEEEEPNYDDYSQEDLIPEELNQGGEAFGQRVKPKK